MKHYSISFSQYPLILLFTIITVLSCSKNNNYELPPSIEVRNNIVTFQLKDNGYQRVMIGSTMQGSWGLAEMQKIDSVWSYATYINRKEIEYKFIIDDSVWMTDPLNPNVIELEHPFEGYNSVIFLK
jgi:hypothetical protein